MNIASKILKNPIHYSISEFYSILPKNSLLPTWWKLNPIQNGSLFTMRAIQNESADCTTVYSTCVLRCHAALPFVFRCFRFRPMMLPSLLPALTEFWPESEMTTLSESTSAFFASFDDFVFFAERAASFAGLSKIRRLLSLRSPSSLSPLRSTRGCFVRDAY